jgi:hypothetical protein
MEDAASNNYATFANAADRLRNQHSAEPEQHCGGEQLHHPTFLHYSTNGDLDIPPNSGQAISFQAEVQAAGSGARKFFEVYRTATSVAN